MDCPKCNSVHTRLADKDPLTWWCLGCFTSWTEGQQDLIDKQVEQIKYLQGQLKEAREGRCNQFDENQAELSRLRSDLARMKSALERIRDQSKIYRGTTDQHWLTDICASVYTETWNEAAAIAREGLGEEALSERGE